MFPIICDFVNKLDCNIMNICFYSSSFLIKRWLISENMM